MPSAQQSFRLAFSRVWRFFARYIDWILGGGVALIGLTRALLTYRLSFGLGDPSTFFIFSLNTAHGEAIYKDFIHFRMPGFYYYCAAFLKTFGETYASLGLAMSVEAYVLYPLAIFISGRLITGSAILATLAAGFCIALSGIFQLRAALGLVAVAVYAAALRKTKHRTRWLIGAGVALGAVLTQGQEIFLFAAASIVLVELITSWGQVRELWGRLWRLAAGALMVIIPFFVFMAVVSDFKNFVYYAFKYALFIQPKFMNLPFPALEWINWLYYLPLFLYLVALVAFWCIGRLSKAAAIVLSFGILRLASAMGRADMGHLMFSLPEVFIILPWALAGLRRFEVRRLVSWPLLLGVTAMTWMFYLAIHNTTSALLLAPVILAGLCWWRPEQHDAAPKRGLAIASLVVMMGFAIIFRAEVVGGLRAMKIGADLWHYGYPTSQEVSGVLADPQTYAEVTEVTQAVKSLNPSIIFSYPIQPFYYSLFDRHPSRFITFEPQTTAAEVDQAMADLERTKPPVVILDMMQSESLSASISRLSDYITDHYEVTQSISRLDYIKVMKRRTTPTLDRQFLLSLYARNPQSENLSAYHIDNKDGTYTDTMKTGERFSSFVVRPNQAAEFVTYVLPVPAAPSLRPACGELEISSGDQQSRQTVCEGEAGVALALEPYAGREVQIKLRSKDADQDVLWVSPTVRAAVK